MNGFKIRFKRLEWTFKISSLFIISLTIRFHNKVTKSHRLKINPINLQNNKNLNNHRK